MKMKRIALLLAVVMLVGLCGGCAGGTDEVSASEASAASTVQETPAPTEDTAAASTETGAEAAESTAETATNDHTASNAALDFAPHKEMLKNLTTELPITDEDVTLEYWLGFETALLSNVPGNNLNNQQVWTYLEEVTGVNLDLIVVDSASTTDKFNLMIASGDYADMFSASNFSYGIETAYDEDIVIDLTDYLEEYMPNYWTIINSDQKLFQEVQDNDMFLRIFPIKDQVANPVGQGPFVRMDWLEDLDMEVPQTYDELTDVLRAFKTEKGATEPLAMYNTINLDSGVLMGGFGSVAELSTNNISNSALNGYYQVDGEVVYGATTDGTRKYLSWLNKLYNEELIDFENMQNREMNPFSDYNAGQASSGATGYMVNNQPFGGVYSEMAAANGDTECNWWPVQDVAENAGDQIHFFEETTLKDSSTIVMAISSQCENVETALAFLDYGYSYEGSLIMNFGFQKDSGHEVESWDFDAEGEPQFDAAVIDQYDSTNIASATLCTKDMPGVFYDRRLSFEFGERENSCFEAWSTNKDNAYILGAATTLDATEGSESSAIYSDILTYVATSALQFINGDMDVNDDAVWNDYVAKIEDMDLASLTEIVQGAYDRANG